MAPNSNMMSHQPPQQQPSIHETHQNLTALLSNNTPPKEVNHPSSMNNTMINNYSGPGPGQPPPNQYHNNMMANGPSSANFVSTGYNPAVSFSGSSNLMPNSTALSSMNYSASNAMSHTLNALPSQQPNMNSMQPQQQLPGMIQQNQQQPMQPQQQQPGMGMMNGPSSAMGNMNPRGLPGNNMGPRLPNSQVCALLGRISFLCFLILHCMHCIEEIAASNSAIVL